MHIIELETERLRLRQWKIEDFPAFAELNSDSEVMKYFPKLLSQKESDRLAEKCRLLITVRGWGLWAIERKQREGFMGFVGLHEPTSDLPFAPCVEIGWRLAKEHWGQSYATEAAKRVLDFAFNDLALHELVSFTSVGNTRSRAVMERLGMEKSESNFMHPDIPASHPLCEHVLYKLIK